MKLRLDDIGYRTKILYIALGLIIGILSLMFTNNIVRQLKIKEYNEIRLWSHAVTSIVNPSSYDNSQGNIITEIISNNTTIPSIMTDEFYNVKDYINVNSRIVNNPIKLRKELEKMAMENDPIVLDNFNYGRTLIFYSQSTLLRTLRYFPYVQLSVLSIFIMFAFMTFRASKQDEQKRVWIGMAKETAHQLGTPTSSLLGWIEYLKSQNTEQFVIDEMNKDITRLLKVVDRFSKIGAKTPLYARNVVDIVGSTITYFNTRIPKNVELKYNNTADEPMQAMVNEALFEWVIENLLKNALDALQGKGMISVSSYVSGKWIYIDIKDTGKGISKANINRIFTPGYTTKTRGWGLGLSLSKRIISEYHKGKIYVAYSEIDKGTIMRIALKRL